MKIHLLDSALRSYSGHHDNFARGVYRLLSDLGDDVRIHGHRDVEPALKAEISVQPTFERSIYDRLFFDPYDGPLNDYSDTRLKFFDNLQQVTPDIADDDIVFIPTASAAEIGGLADWLSEAGVKPTVWLLFHWGRSDSFRKGLLGSALLRTAIRDLHRAKPKSCWLGATHESLRQGLEPLAGQTAELFPSVTFLSERSGAPSLKRAGPIRVGFLGGMRPQKGMHVIPGVVQKLLAAESGVEIVLQTHGASLGQVGLEPFVDEPRVHMIETWLPDDEEAAMIESLDAVVLPYDRMSYSAMVSGIFTIAAAFGKPCIVPSDTWMSAMVADGRVSGEIFDGNEPDAIVAAIARIVADPGRYRLAGEALAVPWAYDHATDRLITELAGRYRA